MNYHQTQIIDLTNYSILYVEVRTKYTKSRKITSLDLFFF